MAYEDYGSQEQELEGFDAAYSEQELKDLVRVGEIARKAREHAKTVAKPGVSFLEVAEKLEQFIRSEGKADSAKPAFPVNLGAGNNAAHYTPTADDSTVVGEKDLLKIDLGVRMDGICSDTAITIDFSGENGKLVEAAQQALQNALSVMKAGVNVKDVGAEIERTITSKGFKPIENLCGHSIEPFLLHAGLEIPNVERGGYELQEGDVFAVEPFASTGDGRVREAGEVCEIFSLSEVRPVRMPASRRLLEMIADEYKTLPFAKRWLAEIPGAQLAINDLSKHGMLHAYPLLREKPGALVSQDETVVIIEKDSVKVLV